MRRFFLTSIVFGTAGLLGPLIMLLSSILDDISTSIYGFINDLLFFIWPTQMMAVIEVSAGRFWAALLAIGANVLLFVIFGLVVAIIVKRRVQLIVAYILVCTLVISWALWGAGFSVKYLNWGSLVIALLIYALPFYSAGKWIAKEK